jgi:heat shock protein HtpX
VKPKWGLDPIAQRIDTRKSDRRYDSSLERTRERMNIATVSLTTRLRTWVLVAGLTALLVVIGVAIGGGFLYLFVGLAVLMNVGGYWFSDRIALAASRAQPVTEDQAPEIYRIVGELAARGRLPMPRIYLIPSDQPNAFATGRNPRHAAVAVTTGLRTRLPVAQMRAVLAHELAHVRNRDILVSSIAAMIAAAISAIATILQFSFLFGGQDDEDGGPLAWLGLLAAIIVAPIAAMLLQLGVSRQREYLADATAAELLGEGGPLADALETLDRETKAAPMAVNPATASLYIANPLPRTGLATLFSTHPPIAERVRRLRSYDGSVAVAHAV